MLRNVLFLFHPPVYVEKKRVQGLFHESFLLSLFVFASYIKHKKA